MLYSFLYFELFSTQQIEKNQQSVFLFLCISIFFLHIHVVHMFVTHHVPACMANDKLYHHYHTIVGFMLQINLVFATYLDLG